VTEVPKIPNLYFITLLFLAAIFTYQFFAGVDVAYAGPGEPGHWHGYPDPDACNVYNDCTYIFDICYFGETQTLGTYTDNPLQPQALVDTINAKGGEATLGRCPLIPNGQRCKLLEVTSPVTLGIDHPISARWRGNAQTLRFRGPSGIVMAPVIETTVHFSDGALVGSFSNVDAQGLALLSPGQYRVSCFGPGGSSGEEIPVTVAR